MMIFSPLSKVDNIVTDVTSALVAVFRKRKADDRETEEPEVPLVRTILVKMDEPDIVLVSKIEDINTDAIMLNAELTLNITQQPEKLAFVLTVDSLRGHTCKFNPAVREQSLAQILQPTNMGMHFNSDTDTNRTRIE